MSLVTGIQSLDDLELENKKVLLRTDLDAPLSKAGDILDDTRIVQTVATIQKLQQRGALVIVASRFGEFRGEAKGEPVSIEPAAARLSELTKSEVFLPDGCLGDSVKKVLSGLRSNQLCVLENLAREADRGPGAEAFARQLASFVDAFVCDTLRPLGIESATTTILPRILEFKAAGPALLQELQAIARIQSGIDPPRLVIWGGNSLSARIDLLDTLAEPAEKVFLVGVAANTMLRALGRPMGKSVIEDSYLAGARSLAERLGDRLVLPSDFRVAETPRASEGRVARSGQLALAEMALDLGPESCATLATLLARAGTAIWCGTVGFHKSEPFAHGTRILCKAMAESSAFTVVTGDDSVAAALTVGAKSLPSIDCLTFGGEAALTLLKENNLSGLEALRGAPHE